ncbi:TetR/AcrR family transcriptional regulator [Endozoicomonas arenosclerae]|uniref:TetR/AcrR family transcriptional regulator n=1 Tax=Endozoicomonas arenosclerae TaxID=1633495 RepID=UPI000784A89B|nr:TetR/AcrR family transcriptional regulator [Endozoicomonas arenosclerae]
MASYHHGNLRETLLAQARKQLAEDGIDKLSLRALARAVGVSQTAPYRHFPDKNALLIALATSGFAELRQSLKTRAEACPDLDAALVEVGLAYVDFAKAHTALYKLMFGPALTQKDSYPQLHVSAESCLEELKALIQLKLNVPESDETLWYITINAAALIKGHTSMILEGNDNCNPATGEEFDLARALRIFLSMLP